jgi:rhodanese-related sulfurtransferase
MVSACCVEGVSIKDERVVKSTVRKKSHPEQLQPNNQQQQQQQQNDRSNMSHQGQGGYDSPVGPRPRHGDGVRDVESDEDADGRPPVLYRRRRAECEGQVRRYHGLFPEIPTMTSQELVDRLLWPSNDAGRPRRDDGTVDGAMDGHGTAWTREAGTAGRDGRPAGAHDDVSDGPTDRNSTGMDAAAAGGIGSIHDGARLVLIDVRTDEERMVSMIPDAPSPGAAASGPGGDLGNIGGGNGSGGVIVVTYCTVGYRSGREARRLRDLYPQYDGRIYNLDGILSYTYVEGPPPLVTPPPGGTVPTTNGPTDQGRRPPAAGASSAARQVHTYGPAWGDLVNPEGGYEAVWFEQPGLARHLLQTVAASATRGVQHGLAALRGGGGTASLFCCCKKW